MNGIDLDWLEEKLLDLVEFEYDSAYPKIEAIKRRIYEEHNKVINRLRNEITTALERSKEVTP